MTSLPVLLPLGLALLVAVPRLRPAIAWLVPLGGVVALGLALFSPDVERSSPWMLPVLQLGIDPVGRVFLGFTSALWIAAGWYARATLATDPSAARFLFFFLLAMAGNFTLILARDVPTFYAGFALMGFTSAGLVLHKGDPDSVRAGTIYVALAVVGEILLFAGFVFLTTRAGTTEIALLDTTAAPRFALLLILVGFGVKAGALSVHFWLPLAHPAAPIPASAVLSGAMIKAGLLGWLRFLPLGDAAMPGFGFGMITLGMAAALLSAFVGVVQANPKTVLAYSSIAQMGIITAGVGIGLVRPEAWPGLLGALLIYATHHALAKGALFLGIGPARQATGSGQRTLARVGLVLPALALAGAPLTSGALAKVALKGNLAFLPSGWADALVVLLPIAAVGTTVKMARFLWIVWPRRAPLEPPAPGIWAPWLFLVAAVAVAVWSMPGTTDAIGKALTPGAVWGATWPLVVGAALAALAHRLQRLVDVEAALPPGDVVVPIERAARALWRLAGRAATTARRLRLDFSPLRALRAPLRSGALVADRALRPWPVAGLNVLLVAAGVLGMLWLGSTDDGPAWGRGDAGGGARSPATGGAPAPSGRTPAPGG